MLYAPALTITTFFLATQCKFEEAKPLYERSLAILEKALGPDHPGFASGLNYLALLLQSQVRVESVPHCLE